VPPQQGAKATQCPARVRAGSSSSMDYKQKNLETYEKYAQQFDEKFSHHFEVYVKDRAEKFITYMVGKRVLDVGAGPGNHAEFFKKKGLDVLAIDISPRMVQICKSKGINAEVHDIENLDLGNQQFDGIWMYASLLHVPKVKAQIVINSLSQYLTQNGLFVVAIKEGNGEQYETHEKYPNTERLFSYFNKEEIINLFPHFKLVDYVRSDVRQKYVFLHFLFQKEI
jgi:2-polyprenyl-3-methyl-5-hydroxy-6-metoxy-1,4-benzoquinol methylase